MKSQLLLLALAALLLALPLAHAQAAEADDGSPSGSVADGSGSGDGAPQAVTTGLRVPPKFDGEGGNAASAFDACVALKIPAERVKCLRQVADLERSGKGEGARLAARTFEDDDQVRTACKDSEDRGALGNCVKMQFGLDKLKDCEESGNRTNTTCLKAFKPKVEQFVGNRLREFTNLFERFESAGYLTADQAAAAKAYLQEKMDAFANAKTQQEKKAILQDVMDKWKDFKANALDRILKAHKNRVKAIQARLAELEKKVQKLKDAGIDVTTLEAALAKDQQLLQKVQDATTLGELRTALKDAFAALQDTQKIIRGLRGEGKGGEKNETGENETSTPHPSETPEPEENETATPTVNATITPTATPEPTPTPVTNETGNTTATPTPTPTPAPTTNETGTATPTPTPSMNATATPTETPTATPTPTPAANGTNSS